MKTMQDIEHLASIHPVLDFCLMQIKSGNISERDGLIEMLSHMGQAFVNMQDKYLDAQTEINRLQAEIERLSENANKPSLNDALEYTNQKIQDDTLKIHIPLTGTIPPADNQTLLKDLNEIAIPSVEPQIASISTDETLQPRQLERKKKAGRGWIW